MAAKANEPKTNTSKRTKKLVPLTDAKVLELAKEGTVIVAATGKTQVGGFINFVREQGVIGLAVGLAIGTAAGAAVKQIVDGFINPIVGFLIGGVDLSKLRWVVVEPGVSGTGGLILSWGAILSAIITLLATALVIYVFIRATKLDRIDRKKS